MPSQAADTSHVLRLIAALLGDDGQGFHPRACEQGFGSTWSFEHAFGLVTYLQGGCCHPWFPEGTTWAQKGCWLARGSAPEPCPKCCHYWFILRYWVIIPAVISSGDFSSFWPWKSLWHRNGLNGLSFSPAPSSASAYPCRAARSGLYLNRGVVWPNVAVHVLTYKLVISTLMLRLLLVAL